MARATTTKAAKPAAKASQAPAGDQKTVDGIFVRSFPPTFRRAGFAFTSEGMGIALDAISAEQLQALQDEPMLSVEFCDFPVDDTSVGAAEAGEQSNAE
ncbi:HI1506-related protein [Pseudomonas sp. CAN2814]|uniref:HI1506-related protein n=1 Tax=Pseudomonas sp. CAN1 TaxID=3046726 RepID=UPI0026492E90|nr:HI1506-related protein [Pseudomonas sp. CAN1]MDN6856991.1 HI1506-related protein [Pseudomonas sp. CAN1]